MRFFSGALALAGLLNLASAAPATALDKRLVKVTVDTPAGSIVGRSLLGVETFAGVPFAEPPVGPLRLRPPVRLNRTLSSFDATGIAAACPQMFLSTDSENAIFDALGHVLTLPILQAVNGQEDCLTINVQRPAGTKAGAKLPVLFWIFGGGFQLGSTAMYDGSPLVLNSIDLSQPFVFVAVNYRVGGFGFMPGKEILADGSSNLGLLDQRMGLEWVADNIAAYGGDPDKVTIWGESAGAISVLDQMVLYNGNNKYNGKALFRGAIMNSGSVVPADPVDAPKGQNVYNSVVRSAGCANAADTLKCLRELPYETFLRAANTMPGILSYHSVALSYLPRPDGTVLTDSPDVLISQGKYAAVPMINGNQEDEGTLFALMQPNVTTTDRLVNYLSDLFFHGASKTQLRTLVDTYSPLPSQGSPFRTGIFNVLYPGFKRNAAILGDLVFTLTRRVFLNSAKAKNPSVPAWSYLASYNYGTPILGTFHGADLLQVFYGILPNYASRSIQTYYTNFVYNLDPNKGTGGFMNWPEWGQSKKLMQFYNNRGELINDDFRQESYNFIAQNVQALNIRDGDKVYPRWGL
ncbi:Alpha/Beta hydrolase protein [Plectosphaerella cucumerina]|jgi:carboxylesterase type B|uniref:Alpha/Beta hydrolase protein n=1 Tax=Plectosphaerella cucumerina TaxID=40658 RepID=A0A8K0T4G2_9PEZI|nr:Alpha/Beta hydrolase protein [Plectosphaerella cucumerina]